MKIYLWDTRLFRANSILSNTIHIVQCLTPCLRWYWTRLVTKLVRYPHYCVICKWSSMVTTNPIYICIFASCIVISSWNDVFQTYILDNAYYPIIWPCKQENGDGNHNKTQLCVHKGERYRIQHHVHSFSVAGCQNNSPRDGCRAAVPVVAE